MLPLLGGRPDQANKCGRSGLTHRSGPYSCGTAPESWPLGQPPDFLLRSVALLNFSFFPLAVKEQSVVKQKLAGVAV